MQPPFIYPPQYGPYPYPPSASGNFRNWRTDYGYMIPEEYFEYFGETRMIRSENMSVQYDANSLDYVLVTGGQNTLPFSLQGRGVDTRKCLMLVRTQTRKNVDTRLFYPGDFAHDYHSVYLKTAAREYGINSNSVHYFERERQLALDFFPLIVERIQNEFYEQIQRGNYEILGTHYRQQLLQWRTLLNNNAVEHNIQPDDIFQLTLIQIMLSHISCTCEDKRFRKVPHCKHMFFFIKHVTVNNLFPISHRRGITRNVVLNYLNTLYELEPIVNDDNNNNGNNNNNDNNNNGNNNNNNNNNDNNYNGGDNNNNDDDDNYFNNYYNSQSNNNNSFENY